MHPGQEQFWVYVVWNARHQKYYVGQTGDLESRVAQHNDPGNDFSKFTKRFPGEWELLHAEEFPTRADALKRERSLKGGQGRDWIKKTVLPGP
ncbi:MAG: GIY-YIG nuclease family protein [Akkermansiaceae bacterium]|nr:GIY-YIG nuclease family protein [Akkermansiaceae bacterium]